MRVRPHVLAIAIAASVPLIGCDSVPTDRVLRVPDGPRFASSANFSDWSQPVSLGPLVNSANSEQQPTVTKDGLTLYFTSGRPLEGHPAGDLNIFVSHRACTDIDDADCAWEAPVALGPEINTEYLDATPALSRDEHYLFFASQRPRDNCAPEPPAVCDRDLYVSYREDVHDDLAWQAPVNLGPAINTAAEDLAPAYFDGAGGAPQLFFTRGLVAAADLYVSTMQPDGSWGTATGITELNTNGNAEARPSLTNDGLLMYFWSTRTTAARIFTTTRENTGASWSAPQLVPPPIDGASTQQPFIYSHGNTESLYFIRTTTTGGLDMFVSERSRGSH
ncbi:MAG TPA: hypothetical protein VJ840_07385 [Gemmatimonadaceae bacterium]|nr:hypothetical protein [Gemmatimonadaceae bacterium]